MIQSNTNRTRHSTVDHFQNKLILYTYILGLNKKKSEAVQNAILSGVKIVAIRDSRGLLSHCNFL